MLASTIIPALIPKKGKGVYNKNNFFEQIKDKYPELFKKSNYPLSNIFTDNLLKDNKNFEGCFSKDQIILLKTNKSLIYNTNNSDKNSGHWCSIKRINNTIYVFDSFGIGYVPKNIYNIYKNFNIITNYI